MHCKNIERGRYSDRHPLSRARPLQPAIARSATAGRLPRSRTSSRARPLLPMFPELTDEQIARVAEAIHVFAGSQLSAAHV